MPTATPTIESAVTTIAGTGASSYSGDNGAASSAALYNPQGVALDSAGTGSFTLFTISLANSTYYLGNIYIADYSNHRIRKVTVATGIITTIAGIGSNSCSGDGGQATSAEVRYPEGITVDSSGNFYFAGWGCCRVRKVTVSTGIISAFAGTGSAGSTGDGGAATSATLYNPRSVAVDSSGIPPFGVVIRYK